MAVSHPTEIRYIVTGKVAEQNLPGRIRNLISAESAANDGLAYPFVSDRAEEEGVQEAVDRFFICPRSNGCSLCSTLQKTLARAAELILKNLMSHLSTSEKRELQKERGEVLQQLEDWLETPMLLLSFGWLALLVVELIWGLSSLLEVISNAIWIVFVLDFVVRFTLAPHKLAYLKQNWLTALSLLLPALRVFRITRVLRLLRATRGLRLVRVISSLNRGMRSLRASMARRGFGYLMALTLVVTLVGAAGMYAFESTTPDGRGLKDYGTALWWTAMLMTTMGSEYWPQTPEGRVLCLILALYAFAVFGYVTATLATFFIGRDADNEEAEVAGAKSIAALHEEIAGLRADIQALSRQNPEA